MQSSNPCKKDCLDRSPTCHITCEAYREYKRHTAELAEKIKSKKITHREYTQYSIDNVYRNKRKKGRL